MSSSAWSPFDCLDDRIDTVVERMNERMKKMEQRMNDLESAFKDLEWFVAYKGGVNEIPTSE